MKIRKIMYLNFRERYEFMVDHQSYTQNLSSCEINDTSFGNALHQYCRGHGFESCLGLNFNKKLR